MQKKTLQTIFTVGVLIYLLSACIGANPSPTEAPASVSPSRTSSPSKTLKPTATPSLTRTPTVTPTATPIPEVTLDGSIDLDRFYPSGVFIVHFLNPMDVASSEMPIKVFPYSEGVYFWDSSYRMLAFQSTAPLEIGQTYTFYLDSSLHTSTGLSLGKAYEWQIQVDRGPEVVSYSPSIRELDTRKPQVDITFNRPMEQVITNNSFSIQPALAYEIAWADESTARIQITEAMQPGFRYDFRFAGGESIPGATDTNGIAMQDDYIVSYWTAPLEIKVETTGENTIEVSFNYEIAQQIPDSIFSIEPLLEGNWSWETSKQARFESTVPIPLAQKYELKVSDNLSDEFGTLQATTSSYAFTAVPPLTIRNPGEKYTYSSIDEWYYSIGLSPIKVDFEIPVDHASIETAFQILPEMPGAFVWKGDPITTGEETLEFYPSRLFDPDTTYTISILPSARSVQDQPILVEPINFSFTTK